MLKSRWTEPGVRELVGEDRPGLQQREAGHERQQAEQPRVRGGEQEDPDVRDDQPQHPGGHRRSSPSRSAASSGRSASAAVQLAEPRRRQPARGGVLVQRRLARGDRAEERVQRHREIPVVVRRRGQRAVDRHRDPQLLVQLAREAVRGALAGGSCRPGTPTSTAGSSRRCAASPARARRARGPRRRPGGGGARALRRSAVHDPAEGAHPGVLVG